jgi:hypothetical protein
MQQGGFTAVTGLSDGLSVPEVASKGVYNTNICRKSGEVCRALIVSTVVFSILPP